MRFSHFLLGLAGLAGLAAAAPTPDAGSVQVVDGVDASPVAAADTVLDEYLAMIYATPGQTIRATIDAASLGQCFYLPDSVAHKVTYIAQHKGLVCKYFRKSCDEVGPKWTIDSRREEFAMPVSRSLGRGLVLVMCKKDDWSTGEVADAAEGPAIHARAIEDRPVDALDAPGQGLPPLKVDDVMFCRDDHCAILNSVPNECMKVVGDFRGRITQIRQGKGTHCKYYTSDKCDSAAIIHETTSNLNQDTSLVGALKGIAAITCEPTAGSITVCKAPGVCTSISALDKWIELSSDLNHQVNEITQRAGAKCNYFTGYGGKWLFGKHTPAEDGDQPINEDVKQVGLVWCELESPTAIFCKTTQPGKEQCGHTSSLRKCTQLDAGLAHQANKITQIAGHYCKYYKDCGEHLLFDAHSGDADSHYIGDGVINKVGGIYCDLEDKAAQLAETTATLKADPTPLVKKAIAKAIPTTENSFDTEGKKTLDARVFKEPGDTIVCHLRNWQFCFQNRINAVKQCANFDPADVGPQSLKQHKGAYCKWFRDFGCGNDIEPLIVNSLATTVEIFDIGTMYNNRIMSVKCETGEW